MDVLVIGGTGLVGQNVVEHCRETGRSVRGTYCSSPDTTAGIRLDKTDADRTRELVTTHRPDVVVDTAAFHAVDACETERDRAWRVNAAGTANAARAADAAGAHFVYLSTDYVFPGTPGDGPYTETDPVSPKNYYGQSKYAGEQAARLADPATVLRPSVVYGLASDNFLTWVLGELRAGNEVRIVDDQVSAPTFARDLARACVDVADRGCTGLYHAAGPATLSRYEFTLAFARACGFDTALVSPVTSDALDQAAPRPPDSTLDSGRLYDALGYRFRPPEAAFDAGPFDRVGPGAD
jgi:dTDP-4-dehydrorhamnose reductase